MGKYDERACRLVGRPPPSGIYFRYFRQARLRARPPSQGRVVFILSGVPMGISDWRFQICAPRPPAPSTVLFSNALPDCPGEALGLF